MAKTFNKMEHRHDARERFINFRVVILIALCRRKVAYMPTEEIIEVKEYEANWEGKSTQTDFKRTVVPADSYNAKLKVIEAVKEPKWNDKEVIEEKIKTILEVDINGVPTEFPHKINPKISKGSTGKDGKVYANSKLYDLLIALNLRETFKTEVGTKFSTKKVSDFLEKNLTGKTLRVSIETKKENTPEAYSFVKKILRIQETK